MMEQRIVTTATKRASAHMKCLYAQYTQDLSTHVFSTINKRTTFFIKKNLTFEEATLGNKETLVLMDIIK